MTFDPGAIDPDMAWAQHLPSDDQHLMMRELRDAGSSYERQQLLHEWRVTAEALSDPEAREILLGWSEGEDT